MKRKKKRACFLRILKCVLGVIVIQTISACAQTASRESIESGILAENTSSNETEALTPGSSIPGNNPTWNERIQQNLSAAKQNVSFDWTKVIDFPSAGSIADCNRTSTDRAPYVAGWMKTGGRGRYTEFAIDFKADYVPHYTYCSLANFYLDYSSLNSQYARVHTNGICGYAGFQYLGPGKSETPVGILSFWEIKCEDKNGNVTKIIPTRVYPEPDDNMTFSGEGDGVHCITDYEWKPGKWYRMLLQCGTSETTGNTTIEQWVLDIESNKWTFLCKYDIGVKNVAFIDDNAVFLENFSPKTAGDVRTMEVKNVRIRPEKSQQWVSVRTGYFAQCFDYPGSYQYGTNKDVFWMITTGVRNKAGKLDTGRDLTVSGGENSSPY